jgi:hypothetical protein
LEQVSTLEAKVASFENWEAEKQRYEMTGLERTGIAYVLNPEERVGKPPHGLCPQCYERRIKSILQSNGEPRSRMHLWVCSICKAEIPASGHALVNIFNEHSAAQ